VHKLFVVLSHPCLDIFMRQMCLQLLVDTWCCLIDAILIFFLIPSNVLLWVRLNCSHLVFQTWGRMLTHWKVWVNGEERAKMCVFSPPPLPNENWGEVIVYKKIKGEVCVMSIVSINDKATIDCLNLVP